MPIEVIMPKVDMDMASGKITVWHVEEGAQVAKGDPLFDIETDKAAMEVEASDDGTLHHRVPEGSDIAIGEPVAWIYGEDEEVGPAPKSHDNTTANANASVGTSVGEDTSDSPSAPAPEAPPAEAVENTTSAAPASTTEPQTDKLRASPLARSLARDGGLDLSAVPGSGPRGRVQAEDVRSVLDQSISPAAPVSFAAETGPLSVTRTKTKGTGTPLVLIHGFASDAQSWAALEPHLGQNPIYRIDLPCHGKSPKLAVASFADLVRQLRQAFDALHLDRAHLIGHSLGGALALALADTRPRGIASLGLIAPAGLGPDINGDVLRGICRATKPQSLGPWLKPLVQDERLISDSYIRQVMTARSDPALRAAQTALAEALFPDGVQAFDLRAALDRVDIPTKILWGKQDRIIPWRHALQAPGRVALHLLEGVGHIPQIESPEEVGKILGSHL